MVPRQLATYWTRLGGYVVDWILLGIVTFPLLYLTHAVHRTHTTITIGGTVSHQTGWRIGLVGLALHAVIVLAYGAILCGSTCGQTLGMMLVGVKAVDQGQSCPIGFGRALGRAAFEYLMAILLFFPWILDMLWPIWDPWNQTLHDKVTRTVVIKT